MKSILLVAGFLWVAFLITSCNKNVEQQEAPLATDSLDTIGTQDTIVDSAASPVITQLIKTDTGIFRGITFGMPSEMIKSLEIGSQLEEEDSTFLDYIVNFNFPESAEVIYSLDNKAQVRKIEAVIYPEDKDSQKKIFDKLVTYYGNRYGKYSTEKDGGLKWQSSLDSLTLLLSKKDGQKVHDINLVFLPGKVTIEKGV